jgi:uncharacterized membrane protein YphA (DoxX/SURF4 family)
MQGYCAQAGRRIYGVAIAAFGILCLAYMNFLSSLQPVPESLPGHSAFAVLLGIALLLAGVAIVAGLRMAQAGLFVAAMFVVGIVVLHIPSAFTNPALLRSPWWIRTFESLALAGAALVLAGRAAGAIREAWVRGGRVLFGISLPVFGVLHFVYAENVASLIPAWYPWPLFLAYLTGFGHFAAGVAIATGVLARLAAILAGFMYATWALTLHLPRVLVNPPTYAGDRPELTSLFVCVAFWGAAWVVAGSLAGSQRPAAAQTGPAS